MSKEKPNDYKLTERKDPNWFEKLTEFFGWIQIMLSPALVGLALGGLFYMWSPDTLGIPVGITFAIIGLLVGIIWATRVKKKHSTIWIVSRIMATPELDEKDDSTEAKKKEPLLHSKSKFRKV